MEKTDYFLRLPNFKRDPTLSLNSEFSLLARERNWKKDSKRYRRERASFLASEFNIHYGSNATKLENWQALCIELGICDSIGSITQCRKVSNLLTSYHRSWFTEDWLSRRRLVVYTSIWLTSLTLDELAKPSGNFLMLQRSGDTQERQRKSSQDLRPKRMDFWRHYWG